MEKYWNKNLMLNLTKLYNVKVNAFINNNKTNWKIILINLENYVFEMELRQKHTKNVRKTNWSVEKIDILLRNHTAWLNYGW